MDRRLSPRRGALIGTTALLTAAAALLTALVLPGCPADSGEPDAAAPIEAAAATLPKALFLAAAPAGAKGLAAAKAATAKVGDAIVFEARIGGRREVWVDGRALMVVFDTGPVACSDIADDGCTTPWDYCCETPDSLAANSATVQVVGGDGKVLAAGLEGAGGLAALDTIVVKGTVAARDDQGYLLVNAEGIYRAP